MAIVPSSPRIASAAAVFCGRYGDVSRYARQRGVCRQRVYREAHWVRAMKTMMMSAPTTKLKTKLTKTRILPRTVIALLLNGPGPQYERKHGATHAPARSPPNAK